MSRSRDFLNSILSQEPTWTTPPMWTTREVVRVKTVDEMSIIPPTDQVKEPLLKIESKDEKGNVVSQISMNLAAVDDQIGKLIKMRDLMADMTEKPSTQSGL